MPIAHDEPGGAASTVLMMNSVEPTRSALVTTSWVHSGCTSTWTPGTRSRTSSTHCAVNRPCTEQWPFHRIIRASRSCAGVRPPLGLCGFHTTQSSRLIPSSRTAVLRPRCWSGRKSTLASRLLRERPLERDLGVGRRADRPAVLAAERLDVGRGVHVGHGYDGRGDAGVLERVPGVLDLREAGHVGHRAAGGEVRQDHLLLRAGEDVGRLGHEVHAAEHDVLRVRAAGGVAGQLEGVTGDVGELDDLVALVVVAEHEHPVAERLLGGPRPGDQVGVGRGGQRPGAVDARLGAAVGAAAQDQQGQVGCRHPVIFSQGTRRRLRGSGRCAGTAPAA